MNENSSRPFEFTASRDFGAWLEASGGSLAFTTYQTGKLFFVGTKPNGQVSLFERNFRRSMGIAASADGRSLLLASEFEIHRFDDILRQGQTYEDTYDALYAPHAAWITGDLDVHDVGFDAGGRPVFVNTLFNCIATVSNGHNFRPLWKPSFISALAAEDRCHLNGMALVDGKPRYATAVSTTDTAEGWRDHRQSGGVVVDMASDTVIAEGLSMPHSPRWWGDRLWLLNSGRGEFGWLDPASGRFEPIAFCPGFARGLTFVGNNALVGLSLPRDTGNFSGLDLDRALVSRGAEPRCGLAVIDLDSGEMVHWARIAGVVSELYDVAFLSGSRLPAAVGYKSDEIKRFISVDDDPANRLE